MSRVRAPAGVQRKKRVTKVALFSFPEDTIVNKNATGSNFFCISLWRFPKLFVFLHKISRRYALLVAGNVGNFQHRNQGKRSGLHAKRGAVMATLITKVFLQPPAIDVANSRATHSFIEEITINQIIMK